MCQRTFERCKPHYVMSIRPKDRQTCCCRYHIEARTLFKSCMNFRKKITQENYNETESLSVYEHINDLILSTMCNSASGEPARKCRNRECENCGIDTFELLPEESDMSETVYRVNWTRYAYTKIRVKSKDMKKLCLVKKSTSPGEMLNYFKEILVTFPAHQFRANWQSNQLKQLLRNLSRQDYLRARLF